MLSDVSTKTRDYPLFLLGVKLPRALIIASFFFSSVDGVRLNWDCIGWTPPTWRVNGKRGGVGAAALTFHTRESPPPASRGEMRKQEGIRERHHFWHLRWRRSATKGSLIAANTAAVAGVSRYINDKLQLVFSQRKPPGLPFGFLLLLWVYFKASTSVLTVKRVKKKRNSSIEILNSRHGEKKSIRPKSIADSGTD